MFWQGMIVPIHYDKWDNKVGGTVVDTFTWDGVEYVSVEFSHSPGKVYTYLK